MRINTNDTNPPWGRSVSLGTFYVPGRRIGYCHSREGR